MRRRPNPWIAIPSLTLGVLAAWLGWVVTDVSCGQGEASGIAGGCNGWALLMAVISFLLVTVGVALLLVLVYRSLSEWRSQR